jgi:hypothetical protein
VTIKQVSASRPGLRFFGASMTFVTMTTMQPNAAAQRPPPRTCSGCNRRVKIHLIHPTARGQQWSPAANDVRFVSNRAEAKQLSIDRQSVSFVAKLTRLSDFIGHSIFCIGRNPPCRLTSSPCGCSLRNRPRMSEAGGIAIGSLSAPRPFKITQKKLAKIVQRKVFMTPVYHRRPQD